MIVHTPEFVTVKVLEEPRKTPNPKLRVDEVTSTFPGLISPIPNPANDAAPVVITVIDCTPGLVASIPPVTDTAPEPVLIVTLDPNFKLGEAVKEPLAVVS